MTINDFTDSKLISIDELNSFFELESEKKITERLPNACWNCGNTLNYVSLPTYSWFACQRCCKCNRINMAIIADTMSGFCMNKVLTFKQRN